VLPGLSSFTVLWANGGLYQGDYMVVRGIGLEIQRLANIEELSFPLTTQKGETQD